MLVEVGPGRALKTFADQTARTLRSRGWHTLTTLPTADEPDVGAALMLGSLGCLWERGATVDWDGPSHRRAHGG